MLTPGSAQAEQEQTEPAPSGGHFMQHIDQCLGALEVMKANGQSAGDSILDLVLIRTLKLDAERYAPNIAARLMAEYKMAALQANIEREFELNKT